MEKTVIELFAGVGGFRIGLNEVTFTNNKVKENNNYKFLWANQWEPATKVQPAFECYQTRFGGLNSNIDISLVDKTAIPSHTLLCGGFPCQDYSVARPKSHEKGIQGKKGVLWWQINDILTAKKPPFVLLENVDRLIKSPAAQRGRDFGIMLRCLNNQGYAVEWRIINAADYGHPQRRRRIYIFAYHKTTQHYDDMANKGAEKILYQDGIFASAFPVKKQETIIREIDIVKSYKDLVEMTQSFKAPFENTGFMLEGKVYTSNTTPIFVAPITLSKIISKKKVDEKYYLDEAQVTKFGYLRGSKKINRTSKSGNKYVYAEGSMSPFDSLDLPGRTMLTSEGTVNRSTHIIKDSTNKLRRLTPVECERLNQFPDNWTKTGMTDNQRYFMMGNALVTGIIKKIGKKISIIIDNEKEK